MFKNEGPLFSLRSQMEHFLREDGLLGNDFYHLSLPQTPVDCQLQFKSDLVVAGLPYFFGVFQHLSGMDLPKVDYYSWEGKGIKKEEKLSLKFQLPFSVVLDGERLALNLLQRACAVATLTRQFVEKAGKYEVAILDTRKTTPGLRFLEKYAVRIGGGHNHRFSQVDSWMIKDNHKQFFGGLPAAINFFRSQQNFYHPLIVEIHSLDELKEAISLNVQHVMLDNFSPEDVQKAIRLKPSRMTFEISGGIRLDNIDPYLMKGVDAISIGGLTHNPPPVDISLKYARV